MRKSGFEPDDSRVLASRAQSPTYELHGAVPVLPVSGQRWCVGRVGNPPYGSCLGQAGRGGGGRRSNPCVSARLLRFGRNDGEARLQRA